LHVVQRGIEKRSVECRRVYDYEHAAVIVYREDTGEEVSTRAMSAGERQMSIDGVDTEAILRRTAAEVNAGALGPDVTAEYHGR
jgi:hypothetical protein